MSFYGYGMMTEEEARLEEYFASAGPAVAKLAPGFRSLRWSVEEVEVFLASARAAGSSLVRSGVNDSLMAELAEAKRSAGVDVDYNALRRQGYHVTGLSVELTPDQQQFLRDDFDGITTIRFSSNGFGDRVKHAVAHAMNMIMSVQLTRKIPAGATVLEVGGSLRAVTMRGPDVGKYFVAKPFLDARDVQRYRLEMRAIRVAASRTGRFALKERQAAFARVLLNTPEAVVIHKKVQEVRVAAEYIVSLQSNWDIPTSHVPAVMYNCGARVWYMVMNRIPGLDFYEGRRFGRVPGLGVSWEADADRDRVVFNFEGDSSLPYVHKLSVVREYQHMTTREFECNGRYYVFSETDFSTRSQLVLACTDMGARPVPALTGYECSVTGAESMIQVSVPTLVSGYEKDARKVYKRSSFMVGGEAFSRVLQDRVLEGAAGSVDSVVKYARSNRVSVVYNGVRVSVEHPVAVEHFRQLAVAVDALARDMIKSSDADVASVAKRLSGGGSVFRNPAAVLGSILGIGEDVSSLFDAVVERLQGLLGERELDVGVRIEQMPGITRVLRSPRVSVKASGTRLEVPVVCFCAEKRETSMLLNGECGGLSVRESAALEHYLKVLEARTCTRCVSSAEALAADYEEECEKQEREELFFDCEEGSSTADSGYSSGSTTEVDTAGTLGGEAVAGVASDEGGEAMPLAEEKRVLKTFEEFVGEETGGVNGVKTRMRQAAEEYVQMLRMQARAAEDDLRQKHMIASMSGSHDQSTLDAVSDEHCWYSYVEIGSDGRVERVHRSGVEVTSFQRVYDFSSGRFYPVVCKRGVATVPVGVSSLVCTSGKMKVWNQPKLIDKALRLMKPGGYLDGPEFRLGFVNGVFGCGKSRGVRHSYVNQAVPGQRLILTATAASARQMRKDLFGDSPAGREFVRTYDSVLMHGVSAWFQEVAFDELAALTMGQAVLLMAYLRPEKARAYGDFFQMDAKPFCDMQLQYPSVAPLCTMEYMSMTHRTRLSVVASSLKHYPAEAALAVCNCCEHVLETEEGGPELHRVNGPAEIPMVAGVNYFTAGQGDAKTVRDLLRASGAVPRSEVDKLVCTYAESQGMTVDRAICVRLERRVKPGSIYHEGNRINVGKSRSRLFVDYYTCSDERDAMVLAARDGADESLRKIVRENSEKVWERIAKAGGSDAYFAHLFEMKKVTYVYK